MSEKSDISLKIKAQNEAKGTIDDIVKNLSKITSSFKEIDKDASKAGKSGKKGLGDIAREADKSSNVVDKLSNQFSKLKRQIGLALGARELVRFSGKLINMADAQAKAEAKVKQAILSTNNAAKLSFDTLTREASRLQSSTIFGDEEILNNVTAQLQTFTNISGENFKRTQKVALDLATVLDGDLKSSAIQLGKALNDTTGESLSALRRSGIQFSKEQETLIKSLFETGKVAEAQSVILDELEKQYGGQAEAATAGAGAIQQLGNNMGDIAEGIGSALISVVGSVAGAINNLFFSTESESDALFRQAGELENTKSRLNALVPALDDVTLSESQRAAVIKQINEISPEFFKGIDIQTAGYSEIKSRLDEVNVSMAQNIELLRKQAVLQANQEKIQEALNDQTRPFIGLINATSNSANSVRDRISAFGEEGEKVFQKNIKGADTFKDRVAALEKTLQDLSGTNNVGEYFNETSKFINELITDFENAESRIKNFSNVQLELEKSFGDDIDGIKDKLSEISGEADDAGGGATNFANKFKGSKKQIELAAGSIAQARKELSDLQKEFINAATASEKLGDESTDFFGLDDKIAFAKAKLDKLEFKSKGFEIKPILVGGIDGNESLFSNLFDPNAVEIPLRDIESVMDQHYEVINDKSEKAARKRAKKEREIREEELKEQLKQFSKGLDFSAEVANDIGAIYDSLREARFNKDLTALENARKRELANTNLTEAQKAAINGKFDARRRRLEQKDAKAKKNAATRRALIDSFVTFGRVLATSSIPFPASLVFATLAAGAVAAQIPKIQSVPAFAHGGPVKGGIEGRDSVHALLMPGEHVIRAKHARKHRSAAEAFNAGDYEKAAIHLMGGKQKVQIENIGDNKAAIELKTTNRILKKISKSQSYF